MRIKTQTLSPSARQHHRVSISCISQARQTWEEGGERKKENQNDSRLRLGLGLSQERIILVRQAQGSLAIGEIDNDGFRTNWNPFTLQAHDGEDNVSPL